MSPPPTLPRAPRTLNIAAPAYPALNALFSSHGVPSHIQWCQEDNNVLGARRILVNGPQDNSFFTREDPSYFSREEINSVCPGLFSSIYTDTLPNSYKKAHQWTRCSWLNALWDHCREPGVYIGGHTFELYVKKLHAIVDIDIKKDIIIADLAMYKFWVGDLKDIPGQHAGMNELKASLLIQDRSYVYAHVDIKTSYKKEIETDYLEQAYPGFVQRAQIGMEMGLQENDLVNYAQDVNSNPMEKRGALLLPELLSKSRDAQDKGFV